MSTPRKSGLVIHLLGAPLIEKNGEAIDLKSRRAEALLSRLAVTGQREDRDALADLLFPRADRERALAGLRQALSILASAIGHEWLAADRHGIQLPDAPGLMVDVRRLAALGDGRRLPYPVTSDTDLKAALGLFRGDFLHGFALHDSPSFDEWQIQERERLGALHVTILGRLVALECARGDMDAAAHYARARVALDPLDEAAARNLMEVLARAGHAAEALRHFERLADALKRELGVVPDPQSQSLRDSIAEGRSTARAARPVAAAEPELVRGNLPAPPNAFVGRRAEMAAILQALGRQDIRLLTLTGSGGIGKTRLALEAGARLAPAFPDGVYLVDLAPVRGAAHIARAVAATLGALGAAGMERPVVELLHAHLRHARMLIVMDNFEHLVDGAPLVSGLLAACPYVKVLATSREPLRVAAENELSVPPMAAAGEDGSTGEAAELFVVRAEAARRGFRLATGEAAILADICARVDGLPLAIELAAAKTRTLSLNSIRDQLADRMGFLAGGARDIPPRQRTLRSEIQWSYDLLTSSERKLLARCSVFAGPFTVEDASAVAEEHALPGLTSLAEKSLLRVGDGESHQRFALLETIRAYAAEKLRDAGEESHARARAIAHYTELAEEADVLIRGPRFREWLDRLDEEMPNLTSCLSWLELECRNGEGLRLAGALGWFWFRRAHFAEGDRWLQLFLDRASEAPAACRANALYHLSWLRRMTSNKHIDNPQVTDLCANAARLWHASGNSRGQAMAQVWTSSADFEQSVDGTVHYLNDGRWEDVVEAVTMARASGDSWALSFCLATAYGQWPAQPAPALAFDRKVLDEALRLASQCGDPFLVSYSLLAVAHGLDETRDPGGWLPWAQDALAAAEEAADIWCRLGALLMIAASKRVQGQLEEAAPLHRQVLRLAADTGAVGWITWAIGGLDWTARAQGRMRRAIRLMAAAVHLAEPVGGEVNRSDPAAPTLFQMTQQDYRQHWDVGWAWSIEEAIAYALSDDD